jgi:hypothetical protein
MDEYSMKYLTILALLIGYSSIQIIIEQDTGITFRKNITTTEDNLVLILRKDGVVVASKDGLLNNAIPINIKCDPPKLNDTTFTWHHCQAIKINCK